MQCVAPGCSNEPGRTSNQEISYFAFPAEPALRAAWLAAGWRPRRCGVVCSRHFLRQDLLQSDGRRALRPGAVPVAGALVCRICLAADSKLYSMAEYKSLCAAYETLTGLSVHSEESLPPFLCASCAPRMLAFARFRARSLRTHSVLLEVATEYPWITVENITEHRKLLRQTATHSHRDFDMELLKTEQIHADVQADTAPDLYEDIAEEVSVNTDIDGLHIKHEVCNDVGIPYDELEHHPQDDKVPLRELTQEAGLSGNGAPKEEEPLDADDDAHRIQETGSTHASAAGGVKFEYDDDGDPSAGNDHPLDDQGPFREVIQKAELSTNGAPEETEPPVARVDPRQKQEIERLLTNEVLSCDICHYQTDSVLQLMSHLKSHATAKPCNGNKFNNKKIKKHSDSGKKPHSLDICNKVYNRKTHLKKPYSCEDCTKSFSFKSNLIIHLRTHSGDKPYSCDVCSKSFSTKNYLIAHLRIHSGDKPYSCGVCSKSFSTKSYLIAHLRIHSCDKPYSCDVCSKSFSTKNNLITHLRIHSGDKPYPCDVCSKSFSTKNNLITHLRIHSGDKPYSCEVCNKSFTRKTSLTAHIRIHSGDKPYSCDICSKSFSRKWQLTTHLRTHSGDKPY